MNVGLEYTRTTQNGSVLCRYGLKGQNSVKDSSIWGIKVYLLAGNMMWLPSDTNTLSLNTQYCVQVKLPLRLIMSVVGNVSCTILFYTIILDCINAVYRGEQQGQAPSPHPPFLNRTLKHVVSVCNTLMGYRDILCWNCYLFVAKNQWFSLSPVYQLNLDLNMQMFMTLNAQKFLSHKMYHRYFTESFGSTTCELIHQ